MSHSKERKEQNCLNCNAVIYGRFCQNCGQENTAPKDTFGHLATHFISDIFHFDGKFFSAARYLLFKPGFLTYEYVRGRRASYLNPIKMYVFISAVFFIFFLSAYKPESMFLFGEKQKITTAEVAEELSNSKKDIETSLANKAVPVSAKKILQEHLAKTNAYIDLLKKDSTRKNDIHTSLSTVINLSQYNYFTIRQYDSIQNVLPQSEKDGWLTRQFYRRGFAINEKYKDRQQTLIENLAEAFFHHFPQVLFVSLPLFALILQLLYVRRTMWYYADHIIYTVHLYCALYIFFFLLLLINKLDTIHHSQVYKFLTDAIWLYVFYYTYKALKNFYNQGNVKTFIKWLLLNAAAYVIMIILFSIYLILSVLTL